MDAGLVGLRGDLAVTVMIAAAAAKVVWSLVGLVVLWHLPGLLRDLTIWLEDR